MNVALFGGTFDPLHNGHLTAARAALADRRFQLDRILFVPTDIPPHKQNDPLTPYEHRFAMVAAALDEAKEPRLVASRLEAPESDKPGTPRYSINTVRKFKQTLNPDDQLYFMLGIDSFLDIAKWREPEALLAECRFIVVSRPGYSMGNALASLPHIPEAANILLLDNVQADVSSTAIRKAARVGTGLEKLVPAAVARYIHVHGLYRSFTFVD